MMTVNLTCHGVTRTPGRRTRTMTMTVRRPPPGRHGDGPPPASQLSSEFRRPAGASESLRVSLRVGSVAATDDSDSDATVTEPGCGLSSSSLSEVESRSRSRFGVTVRHVVVTPAGAASWPAAACPAVPGTIT